jgi:hypothetical protein
MDHLYLILTPILMLGVIALARFVGCEVFFPLTGPPEPTEFVLATGLGPVRNDFTGWVGMAIEVGPDPIEVRELGRTMLTATAEAHIVKIVKPAGDDGVDLGSVEIPASAALPDFAYATLVAPVTLTPTERYYVVSHEVAGRDSWFDTTLVTTTDVAQVTSAIFNDDTNPRYVVSASTGQTFGPVDFKYIQPE